MGAREQNEVKYHAKHRSQGLRVHRELAKLTLGHGIELVNPVLERSGG